MSNAVSALNHEMYQGFAKVEEIGLQGMITLRGDLSDTDLQTALKDTTGLAIPARREIRFSGDKGIAWMSPDELLLIGPYQDTAATLVALNKALSGRHFLAVDVSDARVVFRISGPGAREVIAKLAPVDLSPAAFGPGTIRRTRLAQVPAAFWLSGDEEFTLVAFRSVADYVLGILKSSAKPGGEVGFL